MKVKSISVGSIQPTWDIEVPNGHEYLMANGCVSHNTSSFILGNNECFEPFTSNIYTRMVLAGEYTLVNKHLVRDLTELELWNDDLRREIMRNNGSVQNIPGIPEYIKSVYRTVYEIKQSQLIQMAADRGPFVCQSQSMNLFFEKPTVEQVRKALFMAWRLGLKTGIYYLRQPAAVDAIKFTLENETEPTPQACSLDNPDCISCSA